jgi:cytosine/adenosine deaminase-related metal-dependent hydrolase
VSQKFLIRGGTVLTMGAKSPNYAEADVVVEDGRIVEVGPGLRARDAEVVDASEAIVMPGFVDTHRHVWKSLFRNLGVGADGSAIVSSTVFSDHYTAEDCYAATLIGLLGALQAGVTTVVDWCDLSLEAQYVEASLQAHLDSGLRTVLACASPSREGDPVATVAEFAPLSSRTTLAFGSPDASRGVADQWAAARRAGLRIHAHAGTSSDTAGVVAELGRQGLLGPDVTLVHCTNLSDDDLDAIAASGTGVALAPSVEMATGIGSPPMQRLIDREIKPGLAVDDERLSPGDLFAQMRAVISSQHASYFDLKLAGKAGLPNLLNTRETIRYATVAGARVAGLGDHVGTLEQGRQADIVVLRTDRPNIAPVNDPIGAVVWGMDTSNLDWVFVAGEPLMRDGTLTADIGRARSLAEDSQRRVGASAGMVSVLGGTR